jgi:hypothetical protein
MSVSVSALVRIAVSHTAAVHPKGVGYFSRPAGSTLVGVDSTSGDEVVNFLGSLSWEDVTEHASEVGAAAGDCRYFRATLPEGVSGLEGVRLLSDLTDEQLGEVRLRRGHHGNVEHYIDGLEPQPTSVAHIILYSREAKAWPPKGEVTEASAAVATWYPGRLTPFVNTPDITIKRG